MNRTNHRRRLYESNKAHGSFALFVTRIVGYILVMLVILYGIELMGLVNVLNQLPIIAIIGG